MKKKRVLILIFPLFFSIEEYEMYIQAGLLTLVLFLVRLPIRIIEQWQKVRLIFTITVAWTVPVFHRIPY